MHPPTYPPTRTRAPKSNLILAGWLKYRFSVATTWFVTSGGAAGGLALCARAHPHTASFARVQTVALLSSVVAALCFVMCVSSSFPPSAALAVFWCATHGRGR